MKSLEKLLKGRILVKELFDTTKEKRKWIEIKLHPDCKPSYPFRLPPNSMIGGSPYICAASKQSAKFKLRFSSFNSIDIENEYDPSYDGVGDYIDLPSVEELDNYLQEMSLSLDDFSDSSETQYPM